MRLQKSVAGLALAGEISGKPRLFIKYANHNHITLEDEFALEER